MAQYQFNAQQYQPSEGASPILPEGVYDVQIIKSLEKTNSAQTGSFLEFTLSVINGQFQGRQVKSRFNVKNPNPDAVSIAMGELCAMSLVCGVPFWTQTEQLHGRPFKVKVDKQERTDKPGQFNNNVTAYMDIAGNPPNPANAGQPQGFPTQAPTQAPQQMMPNQIGNPSPQAMPLGSGQAPQQQYQQPQAGQLQPGMPGGAPMQQPPQQPPFSPPSQSAPIPNGQGVPSTPLGQWAATPIVGSPGISGSMTDAGTGAGFAPPQGQAAPFAPPMSSPSPSYPPQGAAQAPQGQYQPPTDPAQYQQPAQQSMQQPGQYQQPNPQSGQGGAPASNPANTPPWG